MDPRVEQQLTALTQGEALRERVLNALHRRSDKPIAVGIAYGGRINCASSAMDGEAADPASIRVHTGCITKVLTATLVTEAVRAGVFSIDTPVSGLLGIRGSYNDAVLSGITVKHLLEHTHGLDDSLVPELPHSVEGWIDREQLCARLAANATLAQPGLVHSYGNAGPWLAAALLENTLHERYIDLLNRRILGPMGMGEASENGDAGSICPATGGALKTTVEGLLRFLLSAPLPHADLTPLPGWSSQEHGIRLGWKHYGSAWFGHNSALPGAAALARVLQPEGLAIVVSSGNHSLANILARLFGNALPALAGVRVPRPLSAEETAALDLAPFVGTYANSALMISITRSKPGTLQLQVFPRIGASTAVEPRMTATLRAAHDNVFYTVPAHTELFPFVQFVEAPPARSRFLWNGRCVWPAL